MLNALLRHLAWKQGVQVICVVARELKALPSKDRFKDDGLLLRSPTREELHVHCKDASLDLPCDWVDEALARGDVCTAAFDGDRMAGYVWSSLEHAPELHGAWVDVPAQAVYRYKSFVRSEYRGRGIAPRLYHLQDQEFIALGRRISMGFIAMHNTPSLAAATGGSGSKVVGYVLVHNHPGRAFHAWHSPGVRRLGVRFKR